MVCHAWVGAFGLLIPIIVEGMGNYGLGVTEFCYLVVCSAQKYPDIASQ